MYITSFPIVHIVRHERT